MFTILLDCRLHLKTLKEQMPVKGKLAEMRNTDMTNMQKYMLSKSLAYSRLEFLWRTNMLDTRSTMKGKYRKDKYNCPHCVEGCEMKIVETPHHLLVCSAYQDLRYGIDPELVTGDRAPYLSKVILRRKELERNVRSC